MSNYSFLVRVGCLTYNHAPYITDTMNGFCIQETNFPFVCTIIDDASTDGEPGVIKKYLENNFNLNDASITRNEETEDYFLIYARHKTNRNCFFAVVLLKYNHHKKKRKGPYISEWSKNVKYTALCEGDDYWTDSLKLQKQVDFLEAHPNYSCVFHRYLIHNEMTNETLLAPDKYFDNPKYKNNDFYEFNKEYNQLVQWASKTLTTMYRAKWYNPKELPQFKYQRDVHLFYYLMCKGNAACMSFIGGVYNKNPRSVFGSQPYLKQRIINRDVYKEFSQKEQDYLLKEVYFRHHDYCKFETLTGFHLLLFRIKRKIRLFITRNKRKRLLNSIMPKI